MRITITGGCGFVGAHLARHLQACGHTITVLDNLARRGSEVNLADLQGRGIRFVHGDVRNADDVLPAIPSSGVVIHCAAQPSAVAGMINPIHDFQVNTFGLFNVLECCRRAGAGLIQFSTNKVFSGNRINNVPKLLNQEKQQWEWAAPIDGNGVGETFPIDGGDKSVYGATKAAADLLCQEYASAFGLPVIVNRCSCLAGTHQWGQADQGWVTWFAIAARLGLRITLYGWHGCQVRDVLFAPDLCRLIEQQVQKVGSMKGEVFNVGGGVEEGFSVSLRQALAMIWRHQKATQNVSYKDEVHFTVDDTPRKSDHCIYLSNIEKVRRAFPDWRPTIRVEQGYQQIFQWVEENLTLLKGLYGVTT